jgi:outer membrane protein TolC
MKSLCRYKLFCIFCFLPCIVLSQEREAIGFEEAGRLAVSASLELKNAKAQMALKEGAWMLGFRSFLPQVSIQASEDERLSLISADSFSKTYTLAMEQLLFDGGRTSASRTIERAELTMMGDKIKRSQDEVMEGALSAYRQILSSYMVVDIKKDTLASLKEQRRIIAEELKLGLVIPLDLAQADITVRETEMELEFLFLQITQQEKQFAVFLGLDDMPELSERIDIYRSSPVPDAETVRRYALSRNPDLKSMKLSITQREVEVKFASRSWIPTVKASGNYALTGQRYPLTRQSWSFGLSLQFASPWFNAAGGGTTGWEPPYDRTARAQTSFTPLPDPAAGLSSKQSILALTAEQENYRRALEQLERQAALETAKLDLAEQKRVTAVEALKIGAEKYRLNEVLLSLGRITRIELMEKRLEYAEKEVEAAAAAAAMLEAERSLERLIDFPPGALKQITKEK